MPQPRFRPINAFTMEFEAADAATAQSVKVGDKVTFSFREPGGKSPLTEIKPAQ